MKAKWTPTGSLLYVQSGLPTTAEILGDWHRIRLAAGEGTDVTKSVFKGVDKDVSPILEISPLPLEFSEDT